MLRPYDCPECGKVIRGIVYFFPEEDRSPSCPECGNNELEKKLIIHLLIGKPGNLKLACPRGQALAEQGPKKRPTHLCSIASACTCYDCLEAVGHDLGEGEVPTRQKASLYQDPIE